MKITITIQVCGRDDQGAKTFEKSQEFPADAERFPAIVSVAEQVLGDTHREYCPTPEEEAEDVKS